MMEHCFPGNFYDVESMPVIELDVCTLAAYISSILYLVQNAVSTLAFIDLL